MSQPPLLLPSHDDSASPCPSDPVRQAGQKEPSRRVVRRVAADTEFFYLDVQTDLQHQSDRPLSSQEVYNGKLSSVLQDHHQCRPSWRRRRDCADVSFRNTATWTPERRHAGLFLRSRSDADAINSPFSTGSRHVSASTDSALAPLPLPHPSSDASPVSLIVSPYRCLRPVPPSVTGTPVHIRSAFRSPLTSTFEGDTAKEHSAEVRLEKGLQDPHSEERISQSQPRSSYRTTIIEPARVSALLTLPADLVFTVLMSFLDSRDSCKLHSIFTPSSEIPQHKHEWWDLWDESEHHAVSELTTAQFCNKRLSFFSPAPGPTPPTSKACHHITLGSWWNKLSPASDNQLTRILSRSPLKTIQVDPGFYSCPCRTCVSLQPLDPQSLAQTTSAAARVDYWLRDSAEQRWFDEDDDRPELARMAAMSHSSLETSPWSNALVGMLREDSSSVLLGSPNRRSLSGSSSSLAPNDTESEGSATSEDFIPRPEPTADALVTAKLHVCARFFWLMRLMFVCRETLEDVDISGYPEHLHTMNDDIATLPEPPLDLKSLVERPEFPRLKRLNFGLSIDCRLLVPLLDFCSYPLLREVGILGLWLRYEKTPPKFGVEPTMVFAPQQIFSKPSEGSPMWMPAIYNGPVDDMLQLQGRGVYVSREYTYEGGFKDGRNDGWGRMVSKCGETYEGEWKGGRRYGYGVVQQASGKQLEGQWVKDVLTGRGSMQMPDGLRYEGDWLNGALDGWGVLSKNKRLLAVGQFSEGKPNGWMRGRLSYCAEGINVASPLISQREAESTAEDVGGWDLSYDALDSVDSDISFEPMEGAAGQALSTAIIALAGDKKSPVGQSKFDALAGAPEWRDVWRSAFPSEERYITALQMLRRPQHPTELLLLNPQLLQQEAGLHQHIRCRVDGAGPPRVPEWVILLVEGLCTL